MQVNNSLISGYTDPKNFDAICFSKIKAEDYLPAFEYWMKITQERLQNIKKQPASFENTIVALEFVATELGELQLLLANLDQACTDEKISQISETIEPQLSRFFAEIFTDELLFLKIKEVYAQKENFSGQSVVLLEEIHQGFIRHGALLQGEAKEKYKNILEKLSILSLQFGKNNLEETNHFALFLEEKDLEGLPENLKNIAKEEAIQKGKPDFFYIGLQAPSYLGFMINAKNRALREKLWYAYAQRGCKNDTFDNQKIVIQMANLRLELAQLLGYKNYADYILSDRMAEKIENVRELEDTLLEIAFPKAQKELAEIENFAKKEEGLEKLERWDLLYYSEKLKKQKFEIDNNTIKNYFSLEKTMQGMFDFAESFFDIKIEKTNIESYHPEVKTYAFYEKNGDFIGLLYIDLFPRDSKRSGAWMTVFKEQFNHHKNQRPHISIVCNFTKGEKGKDALLNFDEITTLFHEFGHALHGLFANSQFPSLSGTHVKWDFVEFPSQLLENFCYESAIIENFAVHYQTGEKIPMAYIEKIKSSANFLSAQQMTRQIALSLLDLAFHTLEKPLPENTDLFAFERVATQKTHLMTPLDKVAISTSFGHIFRGEYAAGYYSYKWAEVLDADAFEYIQEKGVTNVQIGKKLRETVLSKGCTKKGMDLYVDFTEKKPNTKALIKRRGWLNK